MSEASEDRVTKAEVDLIEALTGRIVTMCREQRWKVEFRIDSINVHSEFGNYLTGMTASWGNAGYIQALQYVMAQMEQKAHPPVGIPISDG